MKIAFTGTSGSGKTTLVKIISDYLGIPHLNGSSGALKTSEDRICLEGVVSIVGTGDDGHLNVIKNSAISPAYGLVNQQIILKRRTELIFGNDKFVTDRSPLDNWVYFINQIGFHPQITDDVAKDFLKQCLKSWDELTHVIYIKPCQPGAVEDNKSRIPRKYYQQTVDAQFQYWLDSKFRMCGPFPIGPQVLTLDFWDLSTRIKRVKEFLAE